LFRDNPFASIPLVLSARDSWRFNLSKAGFAVNFSLSEEQVLLQDSVARFVAANCDVARHRRLAGTEAGFDPATWRQFAELGWLGVPFSEEQGGSDGNAVDVMVFCEALGRGLVREPYLATVITCGGFLRHGATPQQQSRFIPAIIDGSRQWAFAFAEPGSGYEPAAVACTAADSADGFRLNGSKIAVLNGHCADYLIVTARTVDEREGGGLSLFVVDTTLPGVAREAFTAVDGSRGAKLVLDNVTVAADCVLGVPGDALPLVEAVIDEAIIAMGGEALGAMQVLLDTTVEYARTRVQFGQPIGKFQALQHRMADMYLKVEDMRSLLYNAAIQLNERSAESALACAALKVKLAEAGRFVSQQAVQLHGGIGMTDELVVGHHFKRLLLLSKLYGDEDYHLQRYLELARQTEASALCRAV
jgi:alkylation response protein AidB-like acyl-CoA dehydrogenase